MLQAVKHDPFQAVLFSLQTAWLGSRVIHASSLLIFMINDRSQIKGTFEIIKRAQNIKSKKAMAANILSSISQEYITSYNNATEN